MVHATPTRPAIKALVFDAYGTLFDVHSVIATCNALFPGRGDALSQLWRTKQLEYTWLRSLMGQYTDFWQVTQQALTFACNALQVPYTPATQAQLMDAYLHLTAYPDVHQALQTLADYPLFILSNGSPRMLNAAVESAGLTGRFTRILSADAVGIYKPSPRVYQLVLQHSAMAPGEVGFVSANAWDISGAQAFGFWTCWVNRAHHPWDDLGFPPRATVARLSALEQVLARAITLPHGIHPPAEPC